MERTAISLVSGRDLRLRVPAPGPGVGWSLDKKWTPHSQTSPIKSQQSPVLLSSRYPHTLFVHSQWPQDKLPVLSATPPGNWLPLLPRSAPSSQPSTLLPAQLPQRLPSPPSSSRPVALRPLTSLAPRRLSMVSTEATECAEMEANKIDRACRLAQGEASRKSFTPQWHKF